MTFVAFASFSVTNQGVFVCDLQNWTDSESLVWQVLRRIQDEVDISLAAMLDAIG